MYDNLLQKCKIDLAAILANNGMIASKTVSGRGKMTLRECYSGLETWFEIVTKHDDGYSVIYIDTENIDVAKKEFLKRVGV